MSKSDPKPKQSIKLRRYPNRRYYDSTRSQHVTLEAIYQLIRAGNVVEVTDSKTGDDITSKVLTQIILEHDAPKLDALPVELLHQLIQTNEPIVRDFIEKYFRQTFAAFVDSQQRFSNYLRETMGWEDAGVPGWSPRMWGEFSRMSRGEQHPPASVKDAPNNDSTSDNEATADKDLRDMVTQLQDQMRQLQRTVDRRK